jgi:hypothetical protein
MKHDATNLWSEAEPADLHNGEPLAGESSWAELIWGVAFAVATMGLVSALALATY